MIAPAALLWVAEWSVAASEVSLAVDTLWAGDSVVALPSEAIPWAEGVVSGLETAAGVEWARLALAVADAAVAWALAMRVSSWY